jgi:hypothetical protein
MYVWLINRSETLWHLLLIVETLHFLDRSRWIHFSSPWVLAGCRNGMARNVSSISKLQHCLVFKDFFFSCRGSEVTIALTCPPFSDPPHPDRIRALWYSKCGVLHPCSLGWSTNENLHASGCSWHDPSCWLLLLYDSLHVCADYIAN